MMFQKLPAELKAADSDQPAITADKGSIQKSIIFLFFYKNTCCSNTY